MNWQPIETAPKDRTEVLCWREDCGPFIASYTSADSFPLTQAEIDAMDEETLFHKDWFTQWPQAFRLDGREAPTHWMPLPAAPGAEPQGAAVDAPADPMDWPLPCDVTVGHGTIGKGCKLRTLVLRMQVLYDMAQKVELTAPAAGSLAQSQHNMTKSEAVREFKDMCETARASRAALAAKESP